MPSAPTRARARSAHAFGAERVERGGDLAATGAQARSAHAIGAERVAQGGDRRERRRLEQAFLTNAAATVRSVGAM